MKIKYDSIGEPGTLSSLRPLYLGEEYGFLIPSLKAEFCGDTTFFTVYCGLTTHQL